MVSHLRKGRFQTVHHIANEDTGNLIHFFPLDAKHLFPQREMLVSLYDLG